MLIPVSIHLTDAPSYPVTKNASEQTAIIDEPVQQPAQNQPTASEHTSNAAVNSGNQTASTPENAGAPTVDWWIICLIVWLGVSAVLLALSYLRYAMQLKRVLRDASYGTELPYQEIAQRLGFRRTPRFRTAQSVHTPFAYGVFKKTIVLPSTLDNFAQAELVIGHELIHCKRQDTAVNHLLLLTRCLNWFNPMVYLLIRACRREMELSCDAKLLKDCTEQQRYEYGLTLLSLSQHMKHTVSISTGYSQKGKQLRERLMAVKDMSKKSRAVLLIVVIALLCGIVVCSAVFIEQKAEQPKKDSPQTVEPQNTAEVTTAPTVTDDTTTDSTVSTEVTPEPPLEETMPFLLFSITYREMEDTYGPSSYLGAYGGGTPYLSYDRLPSVLVDFDSDGGFGEAVNGLTPLTIAENTKPRMLSVTDTQINIFGLHVGMTSAEVIAVIGSWDDWSYSGDSAAFYTNYQQDGYGISAAWNISEEEYKKMMSIETTPEETYRAWADAYMNEIPGTIAYFQIYPVNE